MLKRLIIDDLIKWKNDNCKKVLIIKGARQVGKTYIIDHFGKNYFKNYIRINFEETPSLKEIFSNDLDADTIYNKISFIFPTIKINKDTLIFLDEIQSCPNARVALKFLAIDNRAFVIASGSLLGINYNEVSSFPVGYTIELQLYSLTFLEFLLANNHEKIVNILQSCYDNKTPIDEFYHKKMMDLFKLYIVVGGMPSVVNEYINNKSLHDVRVIQKNIISNYLDDISKYAENNEKTKIRDCFLSIPKNLAKDYKKFQYSVVKKNGRTKDYDGSLRWLIDAGLITCCYNVTHLELPLEGNSKEDEFKVYLNDTGLLLSMFDDESGLDILNDNLGIYKGAIYENIISDILTKNNKKLYYYRKKSGLELDFLIREKESNNLTIIEVKSSENTKAKSFNLTLNETPNINGIKLSKRNISKHNKYIEYPLYLSMFIK